MEEKFDSASAQHRHNDIIKELQNTRDALNKDVINYYYESHIDSESKNEEVKEGMRRFLGKAIDELREIYKKLE